MPPPDPSLHPPRPAGAVALLLLASATLLSPGCGLRAQHPRLSFHEIRLDASRSPGQLDCILQDHRGFVWIGGNLGLWRLDGRDVRMIDVPIPPDSHSPYPGVYDLAEGRDGTLWIAGGHGLHHLDPERRACVPVPLHDAAGREPRRLDLRGLALDRAGRIWARTAEGEVVRHDPVSGTTTSIAPAHVGVRGPVVGLRGAPGDEILLLDATGRLSRGGAGRGWRQRDLGTELLVSADDPERLRLFGRGTRAWIASTHRLLALDLDTGELSRVELPDALGVGRGEPVPTAVEPDARGRLWIGTHAGLLLRDAHAGRIQVHRHDPSRADSLPLDGIRSLLHDRSGALWVLAGSRIARCDARGDIARYDPVADGVIDRPFVPRSLHVDARDRVWVGGPGCGLLVLDRAGEAWLRALPPDPRHRNVRGIVGDGAGRCWVATPTSLLLIDATDLALLKETGIPALLPRAGPVQALLREGDRLWVGMARALLVHDPATGTFEPVPVPLSGGVVSGGLVPGRDGRIWVLLHRGGLASLDPASRRMTLQDVRLPGAVSPEAVRVFDAHDPGSGPLFLATERGVLRLDLDTGETRRALASDGSGGHAATALQVDAAGRLWAGTSFDGIRLVDSDHRVARSFSTWSGGGPNRVYLGAAARGNRGEVVFGSDSGVVIIDTPAFASRPPALDVAITGVAVNGIRVPATTAGDLPLELAPGPTTLSIDFIAFDFIDPERIEYACRLDGFDEDWVDCGDEPTARYTNLPPGRYSIRVRARSPEGRWSEVAWDREIHLAPPLWKTWWLRLAAGAAALALLAVFVVYTHRLRVQGRRLAAAYREHLKIEAEARHLEKQLVHSQKMEAMGRLAGGVAHDFNNILTAMMAHVDMARGELERLSPRPEAGLRRLEEIQSAALRAGGLTGQLLAFSRKQPASPRPVDLDEVLRGIEPMLRRLVRENIELRLELSGGLPPVLVDPSQLEQVVLNLCVNASDAMIDGGVLTLASRSAGGDAGAARGVRLEVRDTGKGMDAETVRRVCEPFFTTKPVGQGTGLGLSMVHGIVTQSGGLLDIRSEPGRGTTVAIVLPATHGGAAELEEAAAPPRRGTETILLCEDDPEVRKLTRTTLQQHGYDVLEARDPAAAMGIAGGERQPIHLLLTDVIMPGMNGLALARRLHEVAPGLPVLYMSGYTADVLTEQRLRLDEIDLLEKPFRPAELLRRVRIALDRAGDVRQDEAAG